MVHGCGNKCVKYYVFLGNLLVCIVGAALLANSLALIFSSSFSNDIVNVIKNAGKPGDEFAAFSAVFYVAAVVGGLLFFTGFLGCCGAACENVCLLGIFFTVILILFLVELGIGIAALVMKGSLETDVNSYYTDTVIKQYALVCNDSSKDLTKSWNATQTDLKCCGCNGYSDYKTLTVACLNPCPYQTIKDPLPGCCPKIWDILDDNIDIIGGVAIGLLVIELLAMIFSCCLCSAVRHKARYS